MKVADEVRPLVVDSFGGMVVESYDQGDRVQPLLASCFVDFCETDKVR